MINVNDFNKLLVTAGAGMGVDSGLPDFRGKSGFWKAYPLLHEKNLSFVEMANPKAFQDHPHLAWGLYGHRLTLYRNTTPHNGFKMLLDLCKTMDDYFVVTSNVDGHFQKAGFVEAAVNEIHGSINYLQCTSCSIAPYENNLEILVDTKKFESNILPRCECGSLLRPNILMFGDFAWNDSISYQQEMRYQRFLRAISPSDKLLIIELGAGLSVPTIQMQSNYINSKFLNSHLIRINPKDFFVRGKRAEYLSTGALEGLEVLGLKK